MKTVSSIQQQILDVIDQLPDAEQKQVLAFARALLEEGVGMNPTELQAFFSQYHFSQEEAAEITKMYDELEHSES